MMQQGPKCGLPSQMLYNLASVHHSLVLVVSIAVFLSHFVCLHTVEYFSMHLSFLLVTSYNFFYMHVLDMMEQSVRDKKIF